MIVLDLTKEVRDELVATLLHGAVERVKAGHPPSRDLADVLRVLRGQESSGVVRSRQSVAGADTDGHGGSMTRAILSRRQAADHLGISVSQLDRLRRDQGLPTVQLGARRVGFRTEDLDAWSVNHAR